LFDSRALVQLFILLVSLNTRLTTLTHINEGSRYVIP